MRCDDCCYSRKHDNYSFECHAYAKGPLTLFYHGDLASVMIVSKCIHFCSRQKELFSFIDD